nr:RNA-directed DNA polymerase, eukaryota [Tanacetum cinerariifolium]
MNEDNCCHPISFTTNGLNAGRSRIRLDVGNRRNKALVERDLGFVMRTKTAASMGIASVFRQGGVERALKPLLMDNENELRETEIKADDAYKEELLDYEEGDEKAPYEKLDHTSPQASLHGDGTNRVNNESRSKASSVNVNHFSGTKIQASGSILDVMDELIKVGQTMGFNMEGCMKNIETIIGSQGEDNELNNKHIVNFVAIQETKIGIMDLFSVKELWGNLAFDYAFSPFVGSSGGILCAWDPSVFVKDNSMVSDSFVAVYGTWIPSTTKLLVITTYASQNLSERRLLWEYLHHLLDSWDGESILLGDFNEVRFEHERYGSVFNPNGANVFNNFIASSSLVDLPIDGYSFTWSHKSASKMSNLARFLISDGLLAYFPSLSVTCLDKHLSDHRPILLREINVDYDSWKSSVGSDSNSIIKLKKKLQVLNLVKMWLADDDQKLLANKGSIQNWLIELDKSFDQGKCTDDLIRERSNLFKDLQDLNHASSLDLIQKAKIRWAVEGDENLKYFHGIINKKCSQLVIRGIIFDGDWIVDPFLVKHEFHSHFSNRFAASVSDSISFDHTFPRQLTVDQMDDLERVVSYDVIKNVVWNCGTNKSSGPDGFTFEFFRKYCKIIDNDVVAAVMCFFDTGVFPPGCNSSFITLIPKMHEAKMVKDFRPISLIGSTYKIIAKVLANRLSHVISDLVFEEQFAFVTNRFILDGPFILNEPFSWCKHKNSKALIFKIDFEKAFDSVRWDYLDMVLLNFGFGSKWRIWIHGCLKSAMGSILVNGSPTMEFEFYKGLKQGDPLSPFLFILIMESLHISFSNVVNAGLFNGIRIGPSFSLFHLFYANDVIFVGKWELSNLSTVINVLKWFHVASGLKINLLKSKIMGISVPNDVVVSAACSIGCLVMHSPFNYLGVKVGASMSRISSWDDVVAKLSARLSKWKLKTLLIGGRLTFIKTVLSSLPLYYMSSFKALKSVLNRLEAIRRNFFNGSDCSKKKLSLISWKIALASKKNGGLGISSFLPSIGAIDNFSPYSRHSPWLDIIGEFKKLSSNGIDLISFIKKKWGMESIRISGKMFGWATQLLDTYIRAFTSWNLTRMLVWPLSFGDTSFSASFRRPPRSGIEEEQFTLLSLTLSTVLLPNSNDRWHWSLDSSGNFSVKSAKVFIDDAFLPKAASSTRWVNYIPIKINIFAWKVSLDKLPTRLNLSLRGLDIPSILCPICNICVESMSHLLFSCSNGLPFGETFESDGAGALRIPEMYKKDVLASSWGCPKTKLWREDEQRDIPKGMCTLEAGSRETRDQETCLALPDNLPESLSESLRGDSSDASFEDLRRHVPPVSCDQLFR